jgi:2-oxoglutarate/2-oxoacid ferredoxin oxidoreductase subunit alpha
VNDFAFMVATKNGSGSQTSNNVLVRSLFKMGIPVNGKNLFPSNIKGLPTWYTIRVSKDGYIARRDTTEIAIAMNEMTAAEDIANLPRRRGCILPQEWKWGHSRDDITYYEIPVRDTIKQFDIPANAANRWATWFMSAWWPSFLASRWITSVQRPDGQLQGQRKTSQMNYQIIEAAYNWSEENLTKTDPYRFEADGHDRRQNHDHRQRSRRAGGSLRRSDRRAWYPITPSTSLIDGVLGYKHLRKTLTPARTPSRWSRPRMKSRPLA